MSPAIGNAKKNSKTTQEIAKYVGKTYRNGADVKLSIKTVTQSIPYRPTPP